MAKIKVRIPMPLQPLTNNKSEVEAEGETIAQIIEDLEAQFPGIKARICEPESGKLRRFVNLYLNEEDIRELSEEETIVKDGDELSIIPAIAGGSSSNSSSPKITCKVKLSLPAKHYSQPLLYKLCKAYELSFIIFEAKLDYLGGEISLQLEGSEANIESALEYLRAEGVVVEKIIKRQVKLTFPEELIKEPLTFEMARAYNVIPNIRRARVTETVGELVIELEGSESSLDRGVEFLKQQNVKVEPVEGDILC